MRFFSVLGNFCNGISKAMFKEISPKFQTANSSLVNPKNKINVSSEKLLRVILASFRFFY